MHSELWMLTESQLWFEFRCWQENDDARLGLCGMALYICGYYVFFSRWIEIDEECLCIPSFLLLIAVSVVSSSIPSFALAVNKIHIA